YDIKTASKYLEASGTVAIGSSVAAGMTRYVTFAQVGQAAGTKNVATKVTLGSATASDAMSDTTTASACQKMQLLIASATTAQKGFQVPSAPDTEHPLFTVAAEKFLSAQLSGIADLSATAYIFVQYFDE
ncbi:hypothetical protein KAW18_15190, partial [candidate division WOR-3 bacterium]|nr:hypothetical protein [candidate division WOR-3 bacterium]